MDGLLILFQVEVQSDSSQETPNIAEEKPAQREHRQHQRSTNSQTGEDEKGNMVCPQKKKIFLYSV